MGFIKRIQSMKSDLVLFAAVIAVMLTFVIEWGSPFVRDHSTDAQAQAAPIEHDGIQNRTAVFTGIVVRGLKQFNLRDSSGRIYTLDDTKQARQFEGRAVKITGELDAQAKVIHIESIVGGDV